MLKELCILTAIVLITAAAAAYLQAFIRFISEMMNLPDENKALGSLVSAFILTILTIITFFLLNLKMSEVIGRRK